AIHRITRCNAVLNDRVATDCADRVLDLDVKVVDRHVEVLNPARRNDDAGRVRVRLLWLQVGITTELTVVLTGRVGTDPAVLSGWHAREYALRLCRLRGWARARIGCTVEADGLRQEQLVDVRRTHGALIARADAEVLQRGPLETRLVGVGLEAFAV